MAAVTGADYLQRVAQLKPAIEAAAAQIDDERKVPAALMAKLHDAQLFRMLLPRAFGGNELDLASFFLVMEAVAKLDASIAWCIGQASGCTFSSVYVEPAVAKEVFGPKNAVLAWGPGPAKAVEVAGGYRVTGNWMFASGGRHATWLGCHTPVFAADGSQRLRPDGSPLVLTMIFPSADAPMKDVWQVIGLRGTASDGYELKDYFVPAKHAFLRDDPAESREPGPLYRLPLLCVYPCGFAGVALGIAGGTFEAFVSLARDKVARGMKGPMRDNHVVQAQVAQAEARLSAARLLLLDAMEQAWSEVTASGKPLSVERRMRIRLASTHAIHEALAVVDTAYHAAGATAIFEANPFERRFRDIHTVAQQVQGRSAHYETVGQFLLGLPADTTWI